MLVKFCFLQPSLASFHHFMQALLYLFADTPLTVILLALCLYRSSVLRAKKQCFDAIGNCSFADCSSSKSYTVGYKSALIACRPMTRRQRVFWSSQLLQKLAALREEKSVALKRVQDLQAAMLMAEKQAKTAKQQTDKVNSITRHSQLFAAV